MATDTHCETTRRLGTFSQWLITRLVQGFFLFVALRVLVSFFYVPWPMRIASIVAVFWVSYLFYSLAYGQGDQTGMTFRRYLKKHHVSWDAISRIDWAPSRMQSVVVVLREPIALSRKVEFPVITNILQIWKVYARQWTPETVEWLNDQFARNQRRSFGWSRE